MTVILSTCTGPEIHEAIYMDIDPSDVAVKWLEDPHIDRKIG
jgi:hypothetical protein